MNDSQDQRSTTSAMVDGEASRDEAEGWLAQWSRDETARTDWHLYQLIGDVMRSEDLAQSPVRDVAFLERLRGRLADQPVVLAPGAVAEPEPEAGSAPESAEEPAPESAAESTPESGAASSPRPRWRLWTACAAAVAGFAVVASAYFTTRIDPEGGSIGLADARAPSGLGLAPSDDAVRRASVGAPGLATPAVPSRAFREILRLPRGPAARPFESMQILYSDGHATISVEVQPNPPPGMAVGAAPQEVDERQGERLNSLVVQRDGRWLTLTGHVPLAGLEQFAAALPPLTR